MRHIDDLRVGRDDLDDLLLHHHDLLVTGYEVSRGIGLIADVLNGIHHILLLTDDRVPQLLGPGELLVHLSQDLGELQERLHAGRPVVAGRLVDLATVVFQVARRLHDVQGLGGGGQNLCQQGIGVQRDRRHELVELLGGEHSRARGIRLPLLLCVDDTCPAQARTDPQQQPCR